MEMLALACHYLVVTMHETICKAVIEVASQILIISWDKYHFAKLSPISIVFGYNGSLFIDPLGWFDASSVDFFGLFALVCWAFYVV